MKIELHMLQNFAPSCLNRDESNAPKDCIFGGVRRARISSQCIKRAVRRAFADEKLLAEENLGHRTKRLAEEVGKRLADQGKDRDLAEAAAATALVGMGFGLDDARQTEYLLFLGESGVQALTNLCEDHWDALAELGRQLKEAEEAGKAKDAKKAKKDAKKAVPDDLRKQLPAVLDGSTAADLALFGRMLADMPDRNIDAACQVAHALSVNKVAIEMDFFTAVDDLKPDDEDAGAGMMGDIRYNSACYYRYAVIDLDQLVTNLGGDRELALDAIRAFLQASATALPTGKQNTFAAHSRPDFILSIVRRSGAPLSLVNAFATPARPHGEKSLTQDALDKLADYWRKIDSVYGDGEDLGGAFCCGTAEPEGDGAGWEDVGSLKALIDRTVTAASGGSS